MDAVLLPLVVVLGNGCETENVRNIKIMLLNCFGMVEGYQEMLQLQAVYGLKKCPIFFLMGSVELIVSIDFFLLLSKW